ncbi:MAG: signal recognition particle-docking protein FtsY [Coxiella sp. (in: Bacteria)]|nr:MAG: signal recognition particle-docking protein FtsY [Coxiella sp. (in: g-proteobacteria)]
MFKFRKKGTKETQSDVPGTPHEEAPSTPIDTPVDAPKKTKKSWFKRLTQGLQKTRSQMGEGIAATFLGKKTIDDELFETLETTLLLADVGITTTQKILDSLTKDVKRKQLSDPAVLMVALKQQLADILAPCVQPLVINREPFILLMVGVNGAGKTTSIAKIANYYKEQNKSIMLAAGDTFRAAAIEQLQVWGDRNEVPVISQHSGADSASVIYDAIESAQAKKVDLLIADTAGRLHTQDHLMEELKKVTRVIGKLDTTAPHEVMLVIDSTMGQNALQQALQFHKSIGLTGITLTKLDGTAKGGIIFAIADQLQLPIRFIGVGEGIEDLKPFNADEFIDALFANTTSVQEEINHDA